jgi:hypothetical protein
VGTILLLIITVALTSVLGLFLFGLVKTPEDPPRFDTVQTGLNGRWAIQFTGVSKELKLSDFQFIGSHANGTYLQYDSDSDGVPDAPLSMTLDKLATMSSSGPTLFPASYIDTNGDGNIDVGDTFLAYPSYVPQGGALQDASRGYKIVGLPPDDIPLDSDLVILVDPTTMGSPDVHPGDHIQIELKHGSHVEATTTGVVGPNGAMTSTIHLDPGWFQGSYKAIVSIRPGEPTEWQNEFHFKASAPAPITPAEKATYDQVGKAFSTGDVVYIVHKPSNRVVLEVQL